MFLTAFWFIKISQGKERSKEENRVKKTEDSSFSLLSHFWSTSRSPFSTYYIPFQSSGSQKSNSSNGAQFGVEMKELQPLQADHSKLKEEFCKVLRNQPFVARISQPFCTVLWIPSWSYPIYVTRWKLRTSRWKPNSQPCEDSMLLRSDFAALLECLRNLADLVFTCEMSLVLPDICAPTLLDLFFRYFCINFHSSPCNQPTIRFLS